MKVISINEAQRNKDIRSGYVVSKADQIIAEINNRIRKESQKIKTHYSVEYISETSHHLAYDIIQKYKEKGFNADWHFDSCMSFIVFEIKW